MAKISRLSNKTWEVMRPPLINNTVSPALLETILPIIRKPVEKAEQNTGEKLPKNAAPSANGKPAPAQLDSAKKQAPPPSSPSRQGPASPASNEVEFSSKPAPSNTTPARPATAPTVNGASGRDSKNGFPHRGSSIPARNFHSKPGEKKKPPENDSGSNPQSSPEPNARPQTAANGNGPRQPGLFLPNNRVIPAGIASRNGSSPTNPPTRPVAPQNGASRDGKNGLGNGPSGGMYRPDGRYNGSKDSPTPPRTSRPEPTQHLSHSEPPVQKPMEEAASQTEAPVPGKNVPGASVTGSTATPTPVEKAPQTSPAQENRPVSAPVPVTPPRPAVEIPAAALKASRSISESLRSIFDQFSGLPEQSAVLGTGEDNLPVLLDLHDPASGAVVVIGDEREQQMDLLRTAITSIAMRNTPRSAQLLIISRDPQPWRDWIGAQGYQRFSIGIEGVEDIDALSEWILRLGDWTEQRRKGERSGPPILVVMDTLSFMPRLPYEIRLNFEWMAKEGPAAQIWPMAAISTELANSLQSRRMLRSFPTRILGFTEQSEFYTQFGSMNAAEAGQFGEPGVFAVRPGDCWLRFRLVNERRR